MLSRIAVVAACVVLPVLWGVLVNWLFDVWRGRAEDSRDGDDSIFPDYQI